MKKNRRLALRITALLLVGAVFSLTVLFAVRLRPLIRIGAEEQARLLTQTVIARAAAICAEEGYFDYDTLICTHYDSQGRVSALRTDTQGLHRLNQALSEHLLALLEQEAYRETSFPLGSALGWDLFSAAGPNLSVGLATRGVPHTELHQEFSEGGINQTLHTLTLRVTLSVRVLLFSSQTTVQVSQDVPVAQTVLLGEVPRWSYPS